MDGADVDGTAEAVTEPALLHAEALECGYAGVPVTGRLDLVVRPGERVGVVGANAAGKSTVLRTLVGDQEPVAGRVRLEGLPVLPESAAHRRALSVLTDEDAYFPTLTVAEHLTLVALGHGVPEPDRVVDRELDFFALRDAADAPPSRLSSGQRRRLLLAAALLRPFRLLALDEPEQRLDAGMRERLTARLAALEPASALVLVTHDPDVLAGAATRCLIVDGRVREAAVAEGAAWIRERT